MRHPNLKLCISVTSILAAFAAHGSASAAGELAECNDANKFLQLPQVVEAMNFYIDHPKGIDMKNIKKDETMVKVSTKDDQIKKTIDASAQLRKSVNDVKASTVRFQTACQALNTQGRQGDALDKYKAAESDLKSQITSFNDASEKLFGLSGNVNANSRNANTYQRYRREKSIGKRGKAISRIGEWGKALNRIEVLEVVGNFERYGTVKDEKFVKDFQQKVNAGHRSQILKGAKACHSSLDKLANSYSSSVDFNDDKSVVSEAKYAIANCYKEGKNGAPGKSGTDESKSSISTKSATNNGFLPDCMLVADAQPGVNCKRDDDRRGGEAQQ